MYLYVYSASTSYNPYYLETPVFDLGSEARFVSYYYFLGANGYTSTPAPLTLQISTDDGDTWEDLFIHTLENSHFATTGSVEEWTRQDVDLSEYINETVIFRFKANSNYGSGRLNQGIDEFKVYDAPTCIYPTDYKLIT